MDDSSSDIGRRVGAHAAGVAFAITYLWATIRGAGGSAALERGAIAALAFLVLGTWLSRPVVGVVIDAIARDQARRQAQRAEETGA